jgi:hypothetical protein
VRLLVVLVVFGAAAFVADGLAARRLEAHAAEVAGELLGAPAEVSVPDRPLLWHLLRGRLPLVRVRARDVPVDQSIRQGIRLSRLSITLRGVHVGIASLRGDEFPRSERGRFAAELDAAAIGQLAGLPGGLAGWRIEDGRLVASMGERAVAFSLSVESGRLTLRGPDGLGVSLPALDLIGLPGEATLEAVSLTPQGIELAGRVRTE